MFYTICLAIVAMMAGCSSSKNARIAELEDELRYVRARLETKEAKAADRDSTEAERQRYLDSMQAAGLEAGYFRVPVFYATDRQPVNDSTFGFTGSRGDGRLRFGELDVTIPADHRTGQIERPSWWGSGDGDDPAKYTQLSRGNQFDNEAVFEQKIRESLAKTGRRDVIVFIHGFNITFEEAVLRCAQLAFDLKFAGVPLLYSWPSRGEVEDYLVDDESIAWTRSRLEKVLRSALADWHANQVHIIGHSMGAQALIDVLSRFDDKALPPGAADLGHVILAAPDVDVDIFRQLAPDLIGKPKRITLYTSRNDRAIKISERIHDNPRLGGRVVVIPGIDTVDASAAATSVFSHSYFGDTLITDIFQLISMDVPPVARINLKKRDDERGVYWELVH